MVATRTVNIFRLVFSITPVMPFHFPFNFQWIKESVSEEAWQWFCSVIIRAAGAEMSAPFWGEWLFACGVTSRVKVLGVSREYKSPPGDAHWSLCLMAQVVIWIDESNPLRKTNKQTSKTNQPNKKNKSQNPEEKPYLAFHIWCLKFLINNAGPISGACPLVSKFHRDQDSPTSTIAAVFPSPYILQIKSTQETQRPRREGRQLIERVSEGIWWVLLRPPLRDKICLRKQRRCEAWKKEHNCATEKDGDQSISH